MPDPRESILARLPDVALLATDVEVAVRNKNEFSDLARPAVVVFDGDEEASDSDPETRPPNAPRRVTMKAELAVLASGASDTIGTTVNRYRAQLIQAITSDAVLIGLVLDGTARQSIRYTGSTVALSSGRAIEAELRLGFAFTYVLRPDQLSP
jgi:hypothetical protein